jgi:hypothetical protein
MKILTVTGIAQEATRSPRRGEIAVMKQSVLPPVGQERELPMGSYKAFKECIPFSCRLSRLIKNFLCLEALCEVGVIKSRRGVLNDVIKRRFLRKRRIEPKEERELRGGKDMASDLFSGPGSMLMISSLTPWRVISFYGHNFISMPASISSAYRIKEDLSLGNP